MTTHRLAPGPLLDGDARAVSGITRGRAAAVAGDETLGWLPAEISAAATKDIASVDKRWLLLTDGEADVAALDLEASLDNDGPPDCEIWPAPGAPLEVALGLGLDASLAFARELGRKRMLIWAMHAEHDDRLEAAAGGSIGRDAVAKCLLAQGATLAQVYRLSTMKLADATTPHPVAPGYRLVGWAGLTPLEWRQAVADLHSLTMSDAPVGDTGYVPEVFTADRVAAEEAAALEGGRTFVTILALTDEGEAVGFCQAGVHAAEGVAWQLDTTVSSAHRGKGLGRSLKTALAAKIREAHPSTTRITTFNAADNRHMLRINEELGWAAVAHKGVWSLPVNP